MKRIALVVVVVLFPPAVFLLWPKVQDRFTTAELAVAVVRQPREEVLVLGAVNREGTAPFGIQTLRIEEPDKEPYRRLVTLDADHRIELTLNKPAPGEYRASLLLAKSTSSELSAEAWLATPALKIDAGHILPREVRVRQYDRTGLRAVAGACAAAWAVLLGFCIAAWRPSGRRQKKCADRSPCV